MVKPDELITCTVCGMPAEWKLLAQNWLTVRCGQCDREASMQVAESISLQLFCVDGEANG